MLHFVACIVCVSMSVAFLPLSVHTYKAAVQMSSKEGHHHTIIYIHVKPVKDSVDSSTYVEKNRTKKYI